jgi:hypothetical protein
LGKVRPACANGAGANDENAAKMAGKRVGTGLAKGERKGSLCWLVAALDHG